MKKLYIVGAGGFGREVYAWVKQHPEFNKSWTLEGFLDDNADALMRFGNFSSVAPL